MKAQTVRQPWANMIALKIKRNETRDKRTGHRGPIAIQAGLKWDLDAFPEMETKGSPLETIVRTRLSGGPMYMGKIVALANLVDCVAAADCDRLGFLSGDERHYGDYTPGRFAYVLRDVVMLPDPVPCRGMPGMYDLPSDVEGEVIRQVVEVLAKRNVYSSRISDATNAATGLGLIREYEDAVRWHMEQKINAACAGPQVVFTQMEAERK